MKNPRQLAQERLEIAYEFARIGERMANLKLLKAEWWVVARPEHKSDASCDRAWDLTKEGQEMETLRLKMKAKQMKSSAIKTMLEVMSDESRNQY